MDEKQVQHEIHTFQTDVWEEYCQVGGLYPDAIDKPKNF
jgi:hypothetical protein